MSLLNKRPVADAGQDSTMILGNMIELDGTGSHDPDGDPLTYSWTIASQPAESRLRTDDITGATNVRAYVEPLVTGTYDFQLTVEDQHAASSSIVTVIVAPIPLYPTADAGGNKTGEVGVAIPFNAGASTIPEGGTIASYHWEFGDGETGEDMTTLHEYTQDGFYTVTLTVTSNAGLTATDTVTVSIGRTEVIEELTIEIGRDITVWEEQFSHSNVYSLNYGWGTSKDSPGLFRQAPAMYFDVADLTGKEIVSATLSFNVHGSSGGPGAIAGVALPIASTWSEATGLTDKSSTWVIAGYDDAEPFVIDGTGPERTVNVTKLVQAWVAGDITNHGVALYANETASAGSYFLSSKEYATDHGHPIPTLSVTYY